MTANSANSSAQSREDIPLLAVVTHNLTVPASCEEPFSPMVKVASSSMLSLPLTLEAPSSPSPPRLDAFMGLIYVAMSAVCFSLVSTCVKYATYSMTSMEFIFWRSIVALVLNYVRCCHSIPRVIISLTVFCVWTRLPSGIAERRSPLRHRTAANYCCSVWSGSRACRLGSTRSRRWCSPMRA